MLNLSGFVRAAFSYLAVQSLFEIKFDVLEQINIIHHCHYQVSLNYTSNTYIV